MKLDQKQVSSRVGVVSCHTGGVIATTGPVGSDPATCSCYIGMVAGTANQLLRAV